VINKIVKFGFMTIFVGLLTACAGSQFYHENIMRGRIVGIDKDELIVYLGSKDGAKEGQELQVYRYVWTGAVEETGKEFRVDSVGTVQIKSIFSESFARAIPTEGSVKKYDFVDLKSCRKRRTHVLSRRHSHRYSQSACD